MSFCEFCLQDIPECRCLRVQKHIAHALDRIIELLEEKNPNPTEERKV